MREREREKEREREREKERERDREREKSWKMQIYSGTLLNIKSVYIAEVTLK